MCGESRCLSRLPNVCARRASNRSQSGTKPNKRRAREIRRENKNRARLIGSEINRKVFATSSTIADEDRTRTDLCCFSQLGCQVGIAARWSHAVSGGGVAARLQASPPQPYSASVSSRFRYSCRAPKSDQQQQHQQYFIEPNQLL